MSPRDSEFHVLSDGTRLPRVTSILKAAFPFANLNWSSYLARDNTRAIAKEVYATLHPAAEGRLHCLGFDAESFAGQVARVQGNAPPHLVGQDSAEIGTAVHAYAEAHLRRALGQDWPLPAVPEYELLDGQRRPSRFANAVQSYLAWYEAHDIRPVSLEQRLVSRKYGYTGTCDLVAYIDDVLTVADFKTSKGIYVEYPIQIAAYRQAVLEMEGDNVHPPLAGKIIRFPKESGDEFEVAHVTWEDQPHLFETFLACMRIWLHRGWFEETHPMKRAPRA